MSKAEQRRTSPRGEGHAPSVDPWKGLRGIMAGTLVLEAIVVLLVLTVVARVDGGTHMAAWKAVYIVVLAVAMILACGVQKKPWALVLDLVLAVLVVLVEHPSVEQAVEDVARHAIGPGRRAGVSQRGPSPPRPGPQRRAGPPPAPPPRGPPRRPRPAC